MRRTYAEDKVHMPRSPQARLVPGKFDLRCEVMLWTLKAGSLSYLVAVRPGGTHRTLVLFMEEARIAQTVTGTG